MAIRTYHWKQVAWYSLNLAIVKNKYSNFVDVRQLNSAVAGELLGGGLLTSESLNPKKHSIQDQRDDIADGKHMLIRVVVKEG